MTKKMPTKTLLPHPIEINPAGTSLDELLGKEWLIANSLGSYASGAVLTANTRRYHGLLVAATLPPVGRIVALSVLMEKIIVGDSEYELASCEFPDSISPRGYENLQRFINDPTPQWIFRVGPGRLTKQVLLAEASNIVAVRYTLSGTSGRLIMRPFAALRDFHLLRRADDGGGFAYELVSGINTSGVKVIDHNRPGKTVYLLAEPGEFRPAPQWWYRFTYRMDLSRGQDAAEDLYSPGTFECDLADGEAFTIYASLDQPGRFDFDETLSRRTDRLTELAGSLDADADDDARRLAMSSDVFVVGRHFAHAPASTTILAGYHWFADWGRDAFIALPGLLLSTRRFQQARQVFRTFIQSLSNGMIPNRFDDYSITAHYNSIDASLWFILAGERYLQATGDTEFFRKVLMPASNAILTAYRNGTRFDIQSGPDFLLQGGSLFTQLTWMDAKLGNEVVTPRHGKAVEINALWYCAHRIMEERSRGFDDKLSAHYKELADFIGPSFARTFWNPHRNCLCDCVTDTYRDESVRPNQIFAVSLPHSPLSAQQQSAVVGAVAEHLLTPMGLRTLWRKDPRYRSRYGGSWQSRDRAYHQGTVWAWLIGPFIEAYLKVHNNKSFAVEQANRWLEPFGKHLNEAGIGFISEIFDGDPPHHPRGCIAQAWSVGEVLRAKLLVDKVRRTQIG